MTNSTALQTEAHFDDSLLLSYIEDEAQKLSTYSEFEINNYIDKEALSLEMQNYLNSTYAEKNYHFQPTNLALTFYENIIMVGHPPVLTGWFADTRDKVKKVVCQVTDTALGNGSYNWKATIKNILENSDATLGNGRDLSAIVTPIIIGYIAKLIKFGYDEV